jgi:hypothetical protein
MSEQNRRVFLRCTCIADEMVVAHRYDEADAVLRALQAYLDVLPATTDGSCRKTTMVKLEEVEALIRIREKSKQEGARGV